MKIILKYNINKLYICHKIYSEIFLYIKYYINIMMTM